MQSRRKVLKEYFYKRFPLIVKDINNNKSNKYQYYQNNTVYKVFLEKLEKPFFEKKGFSNKESEKNFFEKKFVSERRVINNLLISVWKSQ